MDPQVLLSGLSDPSAFPEGGPSVEVVQTHVSIVFLTGERAYKVKKTLNLWGLIDYSTLEKRRFYCEEELRLNGRTAPEVYLGVAPVVAEGGRLRVGATGARTATGAQTIVDWAVVMRRLPAGATLAERIRAGTTTEAEVGEVARTVAGMHARGETGPEIASHGRPVAFARVVRQNFLATRHGVPDLFPAAPHALLARELAGALRRHRGLLAQRFRAGRIVEAHGDLRAEHAVRLGGPSGPQWRVIDALEFAPSLRCLDPLSDAAFLAMDLASMGRRDLERAFLAAYLAEEPDPSAADLLPLYLSYRAHVRAKVDAYRAGEAEIPAPDRAAARLGARRHFTLAWTYAMRERLRPVVVLVGASGTGKSVLARAIAPLLDAEVVSSDPIRKELAGIPPTRRLAGADLDALYAPEMTRRTYAAMLERASASLALGRACVLDATFLRREDRGLALDLARRHGLPAALVSITVPEAEVAARLAARAKAGADASDATLEVHRAQLTHAEAFTPQERLHLVEHDGRADPHDVLMPLLDVVARRTEPGSYVQ